MSAAARKLIDSALTLSEEERLEIVSEIVASIDSQTDLQWKAAWTSELERRSAEREENAVAGRPWRQVIADLSTKRAR